MPQVFRIGSYIVYFWAHESKPLEAIHVHVSKGKPTEYATKIWITRNGKCLLCHNRSRIPERQLKYIMGIVEAQSKYVIERWKEYFGQIKYYC